MTTETSPASTSAATTADAERAGGLAASAIVRTQRALQILRTLQAGQVWSAAELAAQFSCSTRTIFRDLQLLRECGIPIDSPRGERGFRLAHDFFWQPVRPNLDEMIALVVGARMAGEALPKEMAKNLVSAMAKIVGSERPAIRQRLTELNMRIDAPHVTAQPALPDVAFLQVLLEHIVAQTPLRLRVGGNAPHSPAEETAVIPVRLIFAEGRWVLVTSALDGQGEQSVPLDAIERIDTPAEPARGNPA
jgi:predicted DNA-binding transcriptional regulator YafY